MEILFLLPMPIKGSGGHKTILRHVNHLALRGHKVSVAVDQKPWDKHKRYLKEDFESWFGPLEADYLDTPKDWRGEIIVATAWWTAYTAHKLESPYKCYFVQDTEDRFYPAGSVSAKIEASYLFGFPTITIGKWLLTQVANNSQLTGSTPFGVDKGFYHMSGLELRLRKRVIILEQPEKSRRCTELALDTVKDLLVKDPEIEILSFGSEYSIFKKYGARHLGLLSENELGTLYRSATVGVCFSATNPSRVPFEMVSCGLPVVDLNVPGTSLDYCNLPITRSWPRSDLIADEILNWVNGREIMNPISEIATLEEELNSFAEFLESIPQSKTVNVTITYPEGNLGNETRFGKPHSKLWFQSILVWLWKRFPINIKILVRKLINN
jgi:hypothetical protein